jgi:hypothetical protein
MFSDNYIYNVPRNTIQDTLVTKSLITRLANFDVIIMHESI